MRYISPSFSGSARVSGGGVTQLEIPMSREVLGQVRIGRLGEPVELHTLKPPGRRGSPPRYRGVFDGHAVAAPGQHLQARIGHQGRHLDGLRDRRQRVLGADQNEGLGLDARELRPGVVAAQAVGLGGEALDDVPARTSGAGAGGDRGVVEPSMRGVKPQAMPNITWAAGDTSDWRRVSRQSSQPCCTSV